MAITCTDRIVFLLTRRWLLSFAVGVYVLGLLYIVWLDRGGLGWTPR